MSSSAWCGVKAAVERRAEGEGWTWMSPRLYKHPLGIDACLFYALKCRQEFGGWTRNEMWIFIVRSYAAAVPGIVHINHTEYDYKFPISPLWTEARLDLCMTFNIHANRTMSGFYNLSFFISISHLFKQKLFNSSASKAVTVGPKHALTRQVTRWNTVI